MIKPECENCAECEGEWCKICQEVFCEKCHKRNEKNWRETEYLSPHQFYEKEIMT